MPAARVVANSSPVASEIHGEYKFLEEPKDKKKGFAFAITSQCYFALTNIKSTNPNHPAHSSHESHDGGDSIGPVQMGPLTNAFITKLLERN
jgi:hypothetical protein